MTTPNSNSLYCKALSAEEVLKGLFEVAKKWEGEGQLHLQVTTNINGIECAASFGREDELENKFTNFFNNVAERPSIVCKSAHLDLRQPGMNNNQQWQNCRISYKSDNGVIGEFSVNLSTLPASAPSVIDALLETFPITSYLDLARNDSPNLDETALQLRERSVADLKEQVAKLAEFLTGMAEREAVTREELQTKLEESHLKRTDKLETEFRERKEKAEAEHAQRKEDLAKESQKLEAQRKALDLRDEQGVRRELLEKIQTVLKDAEEHNASNDTQNKRKIIHRITYGLFALGSVIAIISGIKIFGAGETDWHFWVVFASSITTIITTAIYYLKWNDRWFREHADAEFAAKRYKADILRASWLAELAGEWQKTKDNEELSPLLVEAFTRNLFADVSIGDPSDHPLDEMSNLLKRASEVSFGKTGFSMKGIKSLTKSGAN